MLAYGSARPRPWRDGDRVRCRGPAAPEPSWAAATCSTARSQRRRVAIKILRPDVAHTLGSDRFLSEIEIASRLTHPHILPVRDSGEAGGVLFYVMPYIESESLREKLTRVGPLPVEEALAIAREIADALAYAHDLDVVHRDIKPGNVLLQAGHAVVADFGVARAISAATDERMTSAGFIVGTPVSGAPEDRLELGPEHLDGHLLPPLEVIRELHRRHCAAAQLPADPIPGLERCPYFAQIPESSRERTERRGLAALVRRHSRVSGERGANGHKLQPSLPPSTRGGSPSGSRSARPIYCASWTSS
jgi:serine/threonine protein kinase